MNRYSQITTSEFNPLSLQEIMVAPLAMRQKHDASIAAAEALRIKANPTATAEEAVTAAKKAGVIVDDNKTTKKNALGGYLIKNKVK